MPAVMYARNGAYACSSLNSTVYGSRAVTTTPCMTCASAGSPLNAGSEIAWKVKTTSSAVSGLPSEYFESGRRWKV